MRKLIDFLYDNGSLTDFKKEYVEQGTGDADELHKFIHKNSYSLDALFDAFVFSETFRGFEFWRDLNMKWVENVLGEEQ